MKFKIIIIIALIMVSFGKAQSYEVVPGSKGNQVILSIFNVSKNTKMSKIKVTMDNNLMGIETKNRFIEVGDIGNGSSKEVVFKFDAKRIPETKTDTLKFVIKDTAGNYWNKQIAITYAAPKEFKLEQNYPNPFNPSTTIEYTIPIAGKYNISVYNIIGQLSATLFDDYAEAGYYKTVFNNRQFASGIYIYRLTGQKINITKKMVLMK
jgi:hypothetical protein